MTYFLGLFISFLIGVVLGLVGGGGSILTVPLVHYLFDVPMLLATTYSLFVVAFSSGIGSLQRFRAGEVSIKQGVIFVIPSMLVAFFIRSVIMPKIPSSFNLFGHVTQRADIITVILISVMLFIAIRALLSIKATPIENTSTIKIVLFGALTGLLSGFIGAGGGFIIVPILLGMGLDMKKAVATSMFIITIQSGIALIGDIFNPEILEIGIDWTLLLLLTAVTIIGVFLGNHYQKKVSSEWLKKAFAILLVFVAFFLFTKLF